MLLWIAGTVVGAGFLLKRRRKQKCFRKQVEEEANTARAALLLAIQVCILCCTWPGLEWCILVHLRSCDELQMQL